MKAFFFRFLILFGFLGGASIVLKGQSLQFSRVIFYEMAPNDTVNINIPADRVWKIETANIPTTSCCSTFLLRNPANTTVAILESNSSSVNFIGPLWLPQGYSGNFFNSASNGSYASISIIEFKVVP